MAKSLKQIQSEIKGIDLIIQVLDARAIQSSTNQELVNLAKDRILVNVALKSDLADLTDKKFSDYESIDEGFMTHKGEFLNREDAWKHAEECGQLSYNTLHYGSTPPVLFSEDLY